MVRPPKLPDLDPVMMPFFGGYGPPARFRQRANAIDAKKYDYRTARTYLINPNGLLESTTHILMWGTGGALQAAHEAYKKCGMWTALPANMIISVFTCYLACTLIWSAQKLYGRIQIAQLAYPDVIEATVLIAPWPVLRKAARGFRYATEGFLMVHSFGGCCVFSLMMARNLKQLVEAEIVLSDEGSGAIKIYILSLMLPCAAVCMVTDLKNLAPFALVTCFYAVALVVVAVWYGFRESTISLSEFAAFKDTPGFFEFVGVCIFTLETATIALPIENNMDKPEQFHYAMLISAPIVTAAMMIVGFFGYWIIGEGAVAPVTVHFPLATFPITLQVFLIILLYVVYAISFYLGFDIEWFYIKRNHQLSNYWFWERIYRTIHVIVLILIAYAVPDVTKLLGFLGCFSTCPLLFLFPPFIELLLDWEHPGLGYLKWRLLKYIAITVLGFAIFSTGTYYNFGKILFPKLNITVVTPEEPPLTGIFDDMGNDLVVNDSF